MLKRSVIISISWLAMSPMLQDCAPAAASEQTAATPERIAELYLAAFVNEDLAKATELNTVLRTAFDGKDSLDVAAIAKIGAGTSAQMAAASLEAIPRNKRAALKEPFTRMSKAMFAAVKRSTCRAVGTTVADNEYVAGNKIAKVKYECQVVDIAPGLATLQDREGVPSKNKPPTPAFVDGVAQVFSQASLDRRVTGEMKLYSSSDKSVWYTGNPGEAYGRIVDEITGPFNQIMK